MDEPAAQPPDVEPEGAAESPLSKFAAVADASWDLFVMPGEHANSRYDRYGRETIEESVRNASASSLFDWGGGGDESEALRLPTGIAAAERLAQGLRPRDKQQPAEDQRVLLLSPLAALAFAAGLAYEVLAGPPQLTSLDAVGNQGVPSRPARRQTEDEWIRERVAAREEAARQSQAGRSGELSEVRSY